MAKHTRQTKAFLQSARQAATFDNAHFHNSGEKITMHHIDGTTTTLTGQAITDFIKKRTRLYRQSWILAYLDELDSILDGNKVNWMPHN